MTVKRAVGGQHAVGLGLAVRRGAPALGAGDLQGVAQGLLTSNPGKDVPGTVG